MPATSRTIIITFGHRYGPVPPNDLYVDVRDVVDRDYDEWEKEALHIIKDIEPGTVVAIGCEDGDDRSATIARIIQKHLENVLVVDRDIHIVEGAGG